MGIITKQPVNAGLEMEENSIRGGYWSRKLMI